MNKKNTRYMLDTNIASYLIKGKPRVIRDHISTISMDCLFISSITEAELLLGVEKKLGAKALDKVVRQFLLLVNILAWDSKVAAQYAKFRADCERQGKPLGTMDMLIAAHALTIDAVLVTNDRAFFGIYPPLKLADWTHPNS